MLSTLILAGFLFHRHHAKPQPKPADDHNAAIVKKTDDYVVAAIKIVDDVRDQHPELTPAAVVVYQDLDALMKDEPDAAGKFDSTKFLKDLDKAQDDIDKLQAAAWRIEHYIIT